MITECAIFGTKVDGSLSQFADELASKLVIEAGTACGAAAAIGESDLLLDEVLAPYTSTTKRRRRSSPA